MREGVPDISWTTEYAELVPPFKNFYAEIGTTWASSVVTFPTVAAHIMGQLMNSWGRIASSSARTPCGTDRRNGRSMLSGGSRFPRRCANVWLSGADRGQAQDPRTEFREALRDHVHQMLTSTSPCQRIMRTRMSKELKTVMELPGYVARQMAKFREAHLALHLPPEIVRYGWIRTTA